LSLIFKLFFLLKL